MTTNTTELDVDTTRVLQRLAELNATIADLTAEAESLKAELRGLPAGDHTIAGRPVLRIIASRRFDATAAATSRLDEDQRAKCLQVSYDAAAVKKYLTPIEVDEFMVENGKPKVVIL
jgi:hypothetical protein